MTVESTTSRVQYSTNGTTGPWSVPYYFLADADLRVVYTDGAGVEDTLTLTVDYTVTGSGVQSGGTVTTVTAYAAGGTITIVRDLDALQPTDYVNTDSFPAETLERNLDRLTMLSQQALEVTNRAITVPVSDTAGSALGPAATRLDRLLAFDAVTGAAEVSAFTASQVAASIAAAQTSGVPGSHILGMEVVTVTAGDTLVNLPSIRYSLGVNSLIAIAGGDVLTAAGGDFTETSASSVTLAQPFAVDTDVTFLVGQLVTSGVDDVQVSTQISGTGAIARSQHDRNEDVFSIMDVLTEAQRANVRNRVDGGNLQAAFATARARVAAAGGGRVLLPYGLYPVSDETLLNSAGVEFVGEGRLGTKILAKDASKKVFNVSAEKCGVRGLSIIYDAQGTSGGVGIYTTAFYGEFSDLFIRYAYHAAQFGSASNSNSLSHFHAEDFTQTGIYVLSGFNLTVDQFKLLCADTTLGALGCIRIENGSEGCNFVNGHTYQGAYSLTTEAATYGIGTRPAYNKFDTVYLDAAANGTQVNECVETEFSNCWFSARPENGVYILNSDGVRFNGGGVINCDKNGALIEATALRVKFIGFDARGNSVATSNTYDGLRFAANTTDFVVTNCTLGGGTLGFGTQRYGCRVETGTSDRYIIADNLVSGNGTGGVSDNGSGSDKRVANNY